MLEQRTGNRLHFRPMLIENGLRLVEKNLQPLKRVGRRQILSGVESALKIYKGVPT